STTSSTSWPGVIRPRSSSSVAAIRARVASASRSSCSLVAIVRSHLTLRDRSIFLELIDCLLWHEILGLQAADADHHENEPDQQAPPPPRPARPRPAKAGLPRPPPPHPQHPPQAREGGPRHKK